MKPAVVGWLFAQDQSAVVYFPPKKLEWPTQAAPGGVAECPAIHDLARHYYVVCSPFSIGLHCTRLVPGESFYYDVVPVEGHKTLSLKTLQTVLQVTPPSIWESPQRPTLQLMLPYVFISDESVYVEQTPAFFSPAAANWPLLVYPGRFPIDVWPRQVNFSFQWTDPGRDILIERGQPLFYLRFLPAQRDRKVRLVEAERTRELENFMSAVRDVTSVVDRSFSLLTRAAELRPPKLLVEKKPYSALSRAGKPQAGRNEAKGNS